MKSKNDFAVSHAKARIGNFVKRLNDCLPSRMQDVNIQLTMTDTDSATYQIRFPEFFKKKKHTEKLVFIN